jgi:cell division protein FtsN
VVMQQDRPVRADRQRMLIAFTGMPAFVVVVGMGWTSVIVVPFTAG